MQAEAESPGRKGREGTGVGRCLGLVIAHLLSTCRVPDLAGGAALCPQPPGPAG